MKKILTSTIPNKRTIKTFHGGFNETNLMFQMSVQSSIHKVKLEKFDIGQKQNGIHL